MYLNFSIFILILCSNGVICAETGDIRANTEIIWRFDAQPERYPIKTTVYGDWDNCPPDTFATSFRVKYSEEFKLLGGVRLYCANLTTPDQNEKKITSLYFKPETFYKESKCGTAIVGFRGVSKTGEISSIAETIKVICADGTELLGQIKNANLEMNSQTSQFNCLPRQAVCGLRTGFQGNVETGEKSNGITHVAMKCCELPSEAKLCKAKEKLEGVVTCSASPTTTAPAVCNYKETIGTSKSKKDENGNSVDTSTEIKVGFSVEYSALVAKAKITAELGYSATTNYNWKDASSSAFESSKTFAGKITVSAGVKSKVDKVIATCGTFTVRPSYLRKTDFSNTRYLHGNITIPHKKTSLLSYIETKTYRFKLLPNGIEQLEYQTEPEEFAN